MNASEKLNALIALKELEKNNAELMLKQNITQISESLNPINIIKNSVSSFFNSSNLVNKVIGLGIAAGTGYFIKKIIENNSGLIMKKLSAMMLEYGLINFVANNKEEIKNNGIKIFNKLFDLKTEPDIQNNEQ